MFDAIRLASNHLWTSGHERVRELVREGDELAEYALGTIANFVEPGDTAVSPWFEETRRERNIMQLRDAVNEWSSISRLNNCCCKGLSERTFEDPLQVFVIGNQYHILQIMKHTHFGITNMCLRKSHAELIHFMC